jgi:hypothetical protein
VSYDVAERASDGRRSRGRDIYPRTAKTPDDAVLDFEFPAGCELDAGCPAAKSVDCQAAQINAVARPLVIGMVGVAIML